ncbi:MAG: glycosyltransferase family 39 protein [Bryobacteraceae bacterium]|nr:glycosyltransferase family 39 protein [Bryobacteraceae bacterium]
MPEILQILFAAAFTVCSCLALGYAALAWLRVACSRGEAWAMSLLVGAALFSTLVLAVGLAGGGRPFVLLVLGLLALASPWFAPALVVTRLRAPVGWVFIAAFGAVYWVHAAAPELSPDGMAYHVALPAQYLRDGRVGFILTNIYAQLSQAMEMLYLHAFAFGQHSSTALVHLTFLCALLALMRAYAVRAGIPSTAGLLVLASPVVGIDAASAYNDIALTAALFAVFWMLERWDEEETDRLLVLAGLMAGFAFALKYTALLALPYALWRLGRRFTAKRLALVCGPALVLMLPWLVKNIVFTGNPVAPFQNAWFPNDVFDPALESSYRRYLGFNEDQPPLSRIPFEVLAGGYRLGGLIGPVFVLTPLVLFSRWRYVWPALLFSGPFALNLGARFLIPGLPFVSLGMAQVLGRWRFAWPVALALHLVLGWYPVTHAFAHIYAWHIKEFPWRAALRIESEGDFLARKVAEYPIFATLRRLPAGAVLTYAQFGDSYTGHEMITGTLSRRGVEMREMIWAARDPSRAPLEGWQFWFPQARLRGLRVSEREPSSGFLAYEIRAYHLMEEFPLARSGVRTMPPSIEAKFLIDGNPVTRWRGAQDPGRRGAIEATWAEPVLLSRFVVQGSPGVALKLEGLGEDGQWRELGAKAETTRFPRGDLRRHATRALRQQGVRWVMLNRNDFGRAEMEDDPAAWGTRLIAQAGGQWLFEVEGYK